MTESRPRRSRPGRRGPLGRITRPPTLVAQVEQALRQAIAEDRFPNGKLPTEVELAEQLGVSRETVRLAAEALQRDGLVVKIRRRGTFTRPPRIGPVALVKPKVIGYLQTDFLDPHGHEEVANREISGRILQGAVEEAGKAGFQLMVRQTTNREWRKVVQEMALGGRLGGLICASYHEEKMLRRVAAAGLPTVLVDEDTTVPGILSVRDDSFDGAVQAVRYLARLGHQRIAYAHWSRAEMNPSRPLGYRKGMRDEGLYRRRQWEISTELTEAGVKQLVDRLLALRPVPTALYCFNNTLASLAIDELQQRGFRVPEDFSVMGAGGEEVRGLTCHQADWHQMGRTAMQILLRALESPRPVRRQNVCLPHVLRVGESTAALKDAEGPKADHHARRGRSR